MSDAGSPPPALAQRLRDALALHRQGRLAEAEAAYRDLLRETPGQFDALHLAGVAAHQQGRHTEAERLIGEALATRRDSAEAFSNFGLVLKALGRAEEAVASFDAALAIRPNYPEALCNRGNAQQQLQRFAEALASYDAALAIAPGSVDALASRGEVLRKLRRPAAALASYQAALAIRPGHRAVLNNSGNALLALRRPAEALACFDRALALRPDDPELLNNRAGTLLSLKQYPAAAQAFAALLAHQPDAAYAAGGLLRARLRSCDWRDYHAGTARVAAAVAAGKPADDPYSFLLHCADANLQSRCATFYSAREFPAASAPVWRGEIYRHRRIRVAYLAAEFQDHATSFLLAGLIERHDRDRFETTAISFGPDTGDAMRHRLRAAFDRFIDVSETTDREVALLLRELEIDIAVDLKGYTGDNRTGILAHRGAPVQVNYLGYPGTMGTDYIDYILADRHVIPPEQERHYSERVVILPDSYQVNDARRPIDQRTPTRAEAGLPDRSFVFCCFNNSYKITPDLFAIWARLLQGVDGSVLWLLEDNAAATRNLKGEASRQGLAPERLVFAPRVPVGAHLARHRLADLFLDTLPVNAHTTASDSLWAGLPLITRTGTTFAGRVATSLLHAVGLAELVTRSAAEYKALALHLARDPGRLAAIRARLAATRDTCALFDTDRGRRHIEAAYVTMWQRQQRGEAPAPFAVAPVA